MKAYQIIDNESVTEQVTVDQQKLFSNMDLDYAITTPDVTIAITAARQRLEAFLNIGIVNRDVIVQWSGCPLELPLSPTGAITYIKKDGEELVEDDFTVNAYQDKTVYINDISGSGISYFYHQGSDCVEIWSGNVLASDASMYEIKYNTGYDNNCPADLILALKSEADYLLKMKGQTPLVVISPNAAYLAKRHSRNLVL